MEQHTETSRSGHPIEVFLCSVLHELQGLTDVAAWSMDAATTTRVVALASRVVAGVAEVETRAISHGVTLDLPAEAECRGVPHWLRQTTGVTRRSAGAKARLAASLARHDTTRSALARGEVHAEQAQAIAEQVTLLADDRVSAHDQRRAEAFLLGEAAHHDADQLSRLGHEIWKRLDPEGADEREARALQAQEERARKKTRLSMRDDGQGLTHGAFSVPTPVAEALRKQLHGFAAPKHVRAAHGAGTYDWHKPSAGRLGEAFVEWIEHYQPADLPQQAGLNATVVVIGDFDILCGKVKAATLDTGARISHTEFLRMACQAGVIPAWMNADGEVLALGRKKRFHTPAQRLAVMLEQQHCQHDSGCDVPAYLCHAHHDTPWSEGGGTDLRSTSLYCPFHHHQIHTTGQRHPLQT